MARRPRRTARPPTSRRGTRAPQHSTAGTLRERTVSLRELIEQARARYLSLFDLAPIGYALLDEKGRVESMNITLATMLGQLRSYMIGLPLLLSVANEDRPRLARYFQQCRESSGDAMACDVILVGSHRIGTLPVHLITRRVQGPDGSFQFLTAIIDQRDRTETIAALQSSGRQLKQAAQALEERTQEAEEASTRLRGLAREVNRAEQKERQRIARLLHDDLQQLLVSAKMRLGMLRPGPMRPEQVREVVDLIDAAIGSSRTLTAQISPPLLQDAGLEAGLRWLARFVHEHHELAVELELGLGAEEIDFSDRDFLFQAAREMLFNVVKHAGVHEARLKANVRHRHVTLEVSDHGAGFDGSLLERDGGEQLGLRTLRERVKLLGGSFVVDSSERRGARIRLNFPLSEVTRPARPAGVPRPIPRAAASGSRSGLVRVLIADDHRVVREGIQSFLSQERWLQIVGQAADGRQAVLMTRELQPDVIIMDISMPELNGIEATRIITGENPRVRIIGLSMHQQEDMASAMLSAGAERYLTKGGPAEDLVQAVRELSTPPDAPRESGDARPDSPA